MYNNRYGYGVYKRNQVNIGAPYKQRKMAENIVEDIFSEAAAASESDPDRELKISQDIVYKAKEDSALIRREAELEADRIISDAQEKADTILAETQQKAKEEGYRHGEELAQQHYNDLLTEAQNFKERTKKEYEDAIAMLEHDIVKLVLDISEKVMGKVIQEKEDIIIDVIKETLNSCSNRENITLKVSSEDYNIVVESEGLLKASIKGIHELEIREDKSLTKGSCIIDTEFGSVDGSCDTRLASIRQAFFELIGDGGQEDE